MATDDEMQNRRTPLVDPENGEKMKAQSNAVCLRAAAVGHKRVHHPSGRRLLAKLNPDWAAAEKRTINEYKNKQETNLTNFQTTAANIMWFMAFPYRFILCVSAYFHLGKISP